LTVVVREVLEEADRFVEATGLCVSAVVGPLPTTDRIGRQRRLDPVPHRISDH
jgi:hypothetical protein